ncbi:MAG: hypothetical protein QOJ15_944 [Bradyrhizobium sp.]|jgi:hypothetical protein|nr:hypothetical protein [Bradyrhizobium sp.]
MATATTHGTIHFILSEITIWSIHSDLTQHAHPGGSLHFALALMHEFPHGWAFVHFLQQVCCASSTQFDATRSRSRPGQGV